MPDQAYNVHRSVTRKERAEAEAVRRAEESYLKTPAALEIRELGNRVQQLEEFIRQLRGEEGVENDGPIFRLTRKPTPPVADVLNAEELELTFCDEDDVQHTATFYIKAGSVVPPF